MTEGRKCGIMKDTVGKSAELTDEFVTDVVSAVELAPDEVAFPYQYDSRARCLWIQLSRAYTWWLRERRVSGQVSLRLHHLKKGLKAKSVYLAGFNLYVVGPTRRAFLGTSKWMHGLDLRACFEAGLDVPDTLSVIVPAGCKLFTHDSEGEELYATEDYQEGEAMAGFVTPVDTG